MMDDIVLRFENVGKLYRLGSIGTGSLIGDFSRWWEMNILRHEDPFLKIGEINDRSKKGRSNYVWALKEISFDVKKGERIGIIGKNGAGKSTLLKLLSRITSPSTGIIKAKGNIATLLEVGTGFHMELSGRENIFMNGAILGMTRNEIARKFDEIVDFAGVERYIDTPVKRYSSGMMVRLGFAVAAFLEPEILVVDEVLAVGDAEFQKKAIGKMQDVSNSEGRTVLFVSHNMASVNTLCNTGIFLDKGKISFYGNIGETIEKYWEFSEIKNGNKIRDDITYKKPFIEINKIELNDTEFKESTIKSGQKSLKLLIQGFTESDFITDPLVIIKDKQGTPLAALAEGHYKGKLENIKKGNFTIEREIILPKFIGAGEYNVDISLHLPMIEYQMQVPNAATLNVEGFFENGGRTLRLSEEGIIGLESI